MSEWEVLAVAVEAPATATYVLAMTVLVDRAPPPVAAAIGVPAVRAALVISVTVSTVVAGSREWRARRALPLVEEDPR